MTLHSLPLFVRLAGRPVILIGTGEAADAKRRLLERAGAVVVEEHGCPLPFGGGASPQAPRSEEALRPGAHPKETIAKAEAPPQPHRHPGLVPGSTIPQAQMPDAVPTGGCRNESGMTDVPPPPPLEATAALAIVALEDEDEALAAVARLKARGILVNAVDRPALCDFTLPAIVDRAPVLIAIGTGGVSAGLAAALRQRLELLLPASLGRLAEALQAARDGLRARWPDGGARRRAIGAALSAGGPLDPLALPDGPIEPLARMAGTAGSEAVVIPLRSSDPDDLTLRQARWLAAADRVVHDGRAPAAILDRARADAARLVADPPYPLPGADWPGLSVYLELS
ncbi:hypothetical protein GCM10011380_10490 [Sphingomonas metalli]|uniref:precorrin-2 dehydrogenase n=1 Tax=Sphingomonas metalli TaxID=1779358 RepID=A0A916T099_9SPHN|nr:bifunctional precorrin-2 dehydrogenase/sirohydrochlorin ferrochelatase [Sphingomonas metalli]GGB22745.1 hypothetical protein GCM10011380_10490 [Sphingomonas metalli]